MPDLLRTDPDLDPPTRPDVAPGSDGSDHAGTDDRDDEAETSVRPWVGVLLTLGLGALVVFAVVALLVPSHLTDPSRLQGKVLMGATFEQPVDVHVGGTPDLEISRLLVPPGETGEWHVHRGYMLTSVASGMATFYDGDDPRCRPHRVGPGQSIVDPPGFPHTVRNEGTVPLVIYNVAITRQGEASVKDVPANPACHFPGAGH